MTERVPAAELEVLRRLWQGGECGIREIAAELYPDGGASAHATVQKLLDRLGAKGFVARRAEGRRNLFRPLVNRRELVARRLRDTADSLCGGDLSPLLTHLVESSELSDEELRELRRLVDSATATGGSR